MKKLILLLFIPLVTFGQNEDVNTLPAYKILASVHKLQEPYNPFLDCDINDNECFQNTLNKHVSDNFYHPQLGDHFDIQAMVNVNYTIDKNGVVKNVSANAALIGVTVEDSDSKKIISYAFEKAANSIIESLPKTNPSIVGGIAVDNKLHNPYSL